MFCLRQDRFFCSEFGSLEVAVKHKEDLFKVMRAIFPVVESSLISHDVSRPVSDKYSRTQLLLSASQLIEENYPLPLKGELRAR
jgi:RNA exonuclease 1